MDGLDFRSGKESAGVDQTGSFQYFGYALQMSRDFQNNEIIQGTVPRSRAQRRPKLTDID